VDVGALKWSGANGSVVSEVEVEDIAGRCEAGWSTNDRTRYEEV